MIETLTRTGESSSRLKLVIAPRAGERALALCDACPMAKFCATKDLNKCPTPEVFEGGGDYGGSAPKTSYRKELHDPTQQRVMADLRPKVTPSKPPVKRVAPPVVNKPNRLPLNTGQERPRKESLFGMVVSAVLRTLGAPAVQSQTTPAKK